MTEWLIDTSALARVASSPDAPLWANRIEEGSYESAPSLALEVGYSARSGSDLRSAQQRAPLSSMPVKYQTPLIEDRAVEVQALLADTARHRAPSVLTSWLLPQPSRAD